MMQEFWLLSWGGHLARRVLPLLLGCAGVGLAAAADVPVTVVTPSSLEGADSAFGAGVFSSPIHIQEVYAAEDFPSGTLLITELRYRPDFQYGKAFSATVPGLEVRLSTTPRGPDGLSPVFSDNPGADETLVFSGALALSSAFSGPAGGPKEFDMVIPLATPFAYSPSQGSLLVDIRTLYASDASRLSGSLSEQDTASRMFGALGAMTGGCDSGADALEVVATLSGSTNPPAPPGFGRVVRGPYLQSSGPSNIVVRWRSSRAADSLVQCGTNPSLLNLAFSNAAPATEHELQLAGLEPETKYYYAIGGNGVFAATNPDTFFITAPPRGASRSTRIWFVSDYGFQNEGETAVRDSYFNSIAPVKPADVWLTGGDNDQIVGSDEREQGSIFDPYAALLRNTPIWPALGNHDTYTASVPGPYPYYDNFTLPAQGQSGGVPSGSEHYFSFDRGDIHFILLDSITPELSASMDTPMTRWLRDDLARTSQRWIIAWWHGPPYTKGSHDSDSPGDVSAWMIQMRQNVLPILEAHSVDLVLNGHSHVYERSFLLHGHYGYSSSFNETHKVDGGDGYADGPYRQQEGKGTVYVVAATGGSPGPFWYGSHPAHAVQIPYRLGSCVMDVTSNRLDFQFVSEEGKALDNFTLLKDGPRPPWRITSVRQEAGAIALSWTSVPGQTYRVEWRPDLATPWAGVSEVIRAGSSGAAWSAPVNPRAPAGFYRVALWVEDN